jgi:hypothetical protein
VKAVEAAGRHKTVRAAYLVLHLRHCNKSCRRGEEELARHRDRNSRGQRTLGQHIPPRQRLQRQQEGRRVRGRRNRRESLVVTVGSLDDAADRSGAGYDRSPDGRTAPALVGIVMVTVERNRGTAKQVVRKGSMPA